MSDQNDAENNDLMNSGIALINLRIENYIKEGTGELLISCTKFNLKIGEILPKNKKDEQEFLQHIMLGGHAGFHMNHGVSINGKHRRMDRQGHA